MKVLVTGAAGFVGKNLVSVLEREENVEVLEYTHDMPEEDLKNFCRQCDFVYNLVGVNRPQTEEEFTEGNHSFVEKLVAYLKEAGNTCPVVLTSSTQAALDNAYGKSKKAGEAALRAYAKETGAKVYVYRFPNVFGKWCRPNYNSAVATFCHNIAHDLPIQVNNRETELTLVYIDDVVEELLRALKGEATLEEEGVYCTPIKHKATLGQIVDLLYSYKKSRKDIATPYNLEGSFEKKLYSTYLSYLPTDEFKYPLVMHEDYRGSFTEILRTTERGQFSVNVSKPGITKGGHWHHTKNEKYLVVSGKALIRFRKHGSDEIIEYHVSGDKHEVVDIPVGYTHTITNEGEGDLVTFMWCNECFNPEKPDTIAEPVDKE